MSVQVAARESDSEQFIIYKDRLSTLLRGIKDQLLVVSVVGPAQAGKSALISHMTGDKMITIGNGSSETTQGVLICGPYSLNSLKKRWGMQELDGDSTKVIFVDTEGFLGGDDVTRVISRLFYPYLAISDLVVLMHTTNVTSNDIAAFKSCGCPTTNFFRSKRWLPSQWRYHDC